MSASTTTGRDAILVVYPFCLDHVGHGNIQRVLAIARYFAASGTGVDLVYQGNPRLAPVASQYVGFRRVFAVDGSAGSSDEDECARRLAAFYSGHERPRPHMQPSAPLTTLVRGLIEAEPYRAVIATYAFTAPVFAGLRRRVLLICDVQDVMHEHATAAEQATGTRGGFDLPAATEAFLWRQWDVLVAITPDDCARLRRDALPHQHLICARHAASAFAPAAVPGADDVAFYAGSDNQSNVHSVTWLLDEIWPRVMRARPTARLRIAGLICAALPERLRDLPGVDLLGFQRDVEGEITACGVVVAPYLYGSGLKIKIVEAACAGKATLTTSGGLVGSGLEPGRAVAVHDDAGAFAGALIDLLGNRARRSTLAEAARMQARALFSPDACYEPLRMAVSLLDPRDVPSVTPGIAGALVERVRLVVEHLGPARVILWGNGSHTRSLIPALAAVGVTADLIVDGRAQVDATSPEGLRVVPAARLAHEVGDLIVLSSETFEAEMWRDLADVREAGGHVLGLNNASYISRDLLGRMSTSLRTQVGAPLVSSRRPGGTLVFWDSGAVPERWWRMCLAHDLALAAVGRGVTPLVAVPASVAATPALLRDFPSAAQILPMIELNGYDVEMLDIDGGARGLARTSDLARKSAAVAIAQLQFRREDALVVVEPSLSECLGLARALDCCPPAHRPSVALWTTSAGRPSLQLSDEERLAYWRLAVSELADTVDGNFAVVTPSEADAARLQTLLRYRVVATGYPAAAPPAVAEGSRAHIVCFGHVGVPRVRPMLEALVEATGEAGDDRPVIAWRSNQRDGRRGAPQRWATDLAFSLGLQLLDEAAPMTVRTTLARADVAAILSDDRGWHDAVRAHVSVARVALIVPSTPAEFVVLVRDVRRGVKPTARRADRHAPRLDDAGTGRPSDLTFTHAVGADEALTRMLDALRGPLQRESASDARATPARPGTGPLATETPR